MTIHDFEHKLLGLIDSMVATATDDELFAGGYLRGHISLAVARAELEGKTLVRDVKNYVLRSLNEAILQGELSEEDEKLVQAMWSRLQQDAEA
ncbi:TPA: YfcL family protein [Aeromonas veronii]|nr:YfcL family protein [Aeromonas veronii]